jgi:NADH:ubiquinone reductase (H+-translocating)
MMEPTNQHIVIIGGGFAGLQLCRKLRNKKGFKITLIDRENHHMFQPLFYQVATARLEPSSISFPFRKIFQRAKNINFLMANVEQIVPNENKVQTDQGAIAFDILVIATGAYTNFFGNENVQEHSLSMKTTHEAIFIRNHMLMNFERMMEQKEVEGNKHIVVVGGGPTGVELAGSFAEMKQSILPKDYPALDVSGIKIYMIEGAEYPLNVMSHKSKTSAKRYLENMGVEVITKTFVNDYDGQKVVLSTGVEIASNNVIWAAGVKGNYVQGLSEKVEQKGNRYKVNRQNKIEGYENIYALGDVAYMETPTFPKGHPQVANVAINQASTLAKNLLKPSAVPKDFVYKDLGSMATVGKHKAVVDLPFMSINGFVAWFIWMFLHLMLILSVRNKLIIFINWAWSYLTRDTSLRLILKARQKSW